MHPYVDLPLYGCCRVFGLSGLVEGLRQERLHLKKSFVETHAVTLRDVMRRECTIVACCCLMSLCHTLVFSKYYLLIDSAWMLHAQVVTRSASASRTPPQTVLWLFNFLLSYSHTKNCTPWTALMAACIDRRIWLKIGKKKKKTSASQLLCP